MHREVIAYWLKAVIEVIQRLPIDLPAPPCTVWYADRAQSMEHRWRVIEQPVDGPGGRGNPAVEMPQPVGAEQIRADAADQSRHGDFGRLG